MRVLELLGRFEGNWSILEKYLQFEPLPPRPIVEFESGRALRVDVRMRWEKAT